MNEKPLVSCLMLTYNRFKPFKRAVQCYLDQTYPNVELVIVNSGTQKYKDKVESYIKDIRNIKHIQVDNIIKNGLFKPDTKIHTIGELRNIGLDNSLGDYVIIYDDDDWHKPDRIEKQVSICESANVHGTILRNFQAIYKNKYYNCSILHGLEGTLLFKNDGKMKYPEMNQGEDTSFIELLKNSGYNIAIIDEEYNTYRYFFYGNNTVSKKHFLDMIKNNEGLR